jgi:hypothetical protein
MTNNNTDWFNIKNFNEYLTLINKYENKITSQNGEDGIIEYIFNNIGTTNKKSCEIGFHSNEANTLNLMKNNWNCLFIDSNIQQVKNFNNIFKDKYINSSAICSSININNINDVIIKNNFINEVDFLSIDIDGNDYFILKNITCCNPRVICIEYNASFGPIISCSIPYNAERPNQTIDYWGVSYMAIVNLLSLKYNLVSVISGVNLFFIRNDIELNNIEIIKNAWQPPFSSTYTNNIPRHKDRLKEQYYKIINLPLYYTNDL